VAQHISNAVIVLPPPKGADAIGGMFVQALAVRAQPQVSGAIRAGPGYGRTLRGEALTPVALAVTLQFATVDRE
jgi:hypothetical protein